MNIEICVVTLVCICAQAVCETKERPFRLTLKNGRIEGKKVKTVDKHKSYYSFQGIPYAKPPVGNLRFASPQPTGIWSDILDVTKHKSICTEIHKKSGSEDCLYLNVFTPTLNASLPVIVWIHGGGFISVYGNYTLSGVDYFIEENVIFVTVHYRLGVFGFLSTEDDIIPGNFGLKDQVMAIEWVHRNIDVFGGDPNMITLMGQSSGAASVSYLSMIPQLEGKIHGIIQQSGSSLCPAALGRNARLGAYILSTKLGVQSQNSSEILEALRKVDAEVLRNNSLSTHIDVTYGTSSFHGHLHRPVLEPDTNDDPLITEMPYELLERGQFNKIPRMIGINSMEGIFMIDGFNALSTYYNNYDQIVQRYIPASMNTRNDQVGELIRRWYTNDAPFTSNITNMVRFGSDDQFVRPILKDAALVSQFITTYLYHFSYEGKLGKENRSMKGVDHGEELPYLFHNANQGNPSVEDNKMRHQLVRLWSNFAKFSNPTPTKVKLLDNQIWLPINSSVNDMNYMDIGSELVASLNPHHKDFRFWNNLFYKYGNPPFDTY